MKPVESKLNVERLMAIGAVLGLTLTIISSKSFIFLGFGGLMCTAFSLIFIFGNPETSSLGRGAKTLMEIGAILMYGFIFGLIFLVTLEIFR